MNLLFCRSLSPKKGTMLTLGDTQQCQSFSASSTTKKIGGGDKGARSYVKGKKWFKDSCFTLTYFDYMLVGDHARKTLHEDIKVVSFWSIGHCWRSKVDVVHRPVPWVWAAWPTYRKASIRVDLFETDFDCHRLYDDDICLHLKAGGRLRGILPGSETLIFFTPQGSVCSRADHCLVSWKRNNFKGSLLESIPFLKSQRNNSSMDSTNLD